MLELHYARRARRRRVDLPCQLICSDWDEPYYHHMVDISPYGVWVKTSFPRNIGERVVLCFEGPHGKELTVFAEVTRQVKRRPGRERPRRHGPRIRRHQSRRAHRLAPCAPRAS